MTSRASTRFDMKYIFFISLPLYLLDRIGLEELGELIVEAWLSRAPKRLAAFQKSMLSDRVSVPTTRAV